MILNDMQRLRWTILDEALRDPDVEYFMGERTATNETGKTRSLIYYVNSRLKQIHRGYRCSKRMLQNDVNMFMEKGARLEPRFRRGHKRILRYINLEWKNPLLKPAVGLSVTTATAVHELEGEMLAVTLRMNGNEEKVMNLLQQPEVLQRQADVAKNTVTSTLNVPVGPALESILLGLGAEVEVLSPESLRSTLRETINAMQKLYKKETSTQKKVVQQSLFGDLF